MNKRFISRIVLAILSLVVLYGFIKTPPAGWGDSRPPRLTNYITEIVTPPYGTPTGYPPPYP